jgi:hypothetical protein
MCIGALDPCVQSGLGLAMMVVCNILLLIRRVQNIHPPSLPTIPNSHFVGSFTFGLQLIGFVCVLRQLSIYL